MLDKRTFNILLLSFGFLLVFVSFQTLSNVLITVIASIKKDHSSYDADPNIALAIIYIVFAVSNFFAPALVGTVGTRTSMVIGAISYALYAASFNLIITEVLYVVSFIVGIGAAIIWTGQGTYLTLNSDDTTMARNSGIFWAIFQCSLLIGNLFVFFVVDNDASSSDQKNIDGATRTVIYNVLTASAVIGILLLCNLGKSANASGEVVEERHEPVINSLRDTLQLFSDYRLLLLCFSFWGTGTLLTFAGSIYGTAIGNTSKIATNAKSYVGLSGVLFGIGEVVGGSIFGLFGSKTVIWGRNPIIVTGAVTLSVCYLLIFMNLPDQSAFHDTNDVSYIQKPVISIALLCSFLLGFGDSCFETQIYSIVGTLFKSNSAPAFAAFKFVQSVACGLAFVYVRYMGLHVHVISLIVQILLAAGTFAIVERHSARVKDTTSATTDLENDSSQNVTTVIEGSPTS